MLNLAILLAAVAAALAIGFAIRARSGQVRAGRREAPTHTGTAFQLLRDAGLSPGGPSIVHFSATWCGPCAAVRRVAAQAISTLAAEGLTVQDLELDIDENPSLAMELKVMSLPTTFVYDAAGNQHHRIAGVPKADALVAALRPLR